MSLHHFTVYDIYKKNANFYKNKTALFEYGHEIGFEALFHKSRSLAAGLSNFGLKKGDRIAVLAQNTYHYFPLFAAASALGTILVHINWRLSREEIQDILMDTEPTVLISDVQSSQLVSELSSNCPFLQQVFVFGETGHEIRSFDSLYLDEPMTQKEEVFGNDPFLMIHTAAVQGKPKGAVLSQENVILSIFQLLSTLSISQNDAYLNILPLYHIMDIIIGLAVMQAGGKNVIMSKFEADTALQSVQNQGISILGTFPPILDNLLSEIKKGDYNLSSVKHVLGLDQPETINKWEESTNSRFWSLYGQTETSGMISYAPFADRPGSAGKPAYLVDMKIVDDFDRDLSANEKGEILIRGPLVFQGYWQEPDLNQIIFRDNWHHTGDLGRLDQDGYLFFMGRKPEKDLIKSGGENVFPVEVEKVILEHPAVSEVSVIGIPDAKFGEGIKALCVLKTGQSVEEKELRYFVGSKIAGYKKPRYISFIDELPKREDGIVDRDKVKELYGE